MKLGTYFKIIITIVMAIGFVGTIYLGFNFYRILIPKSKVPVIGMCVTPDWSPYDDRIVFSAYRVDGAFAIDEPEGKALIYDAKAGTIESIVSLPGLPSKIDFPVSLLDYVAPMVVWTWEKDKLFYLKNGNEGVVFNANRTGFETIFKLPKNQFAASAMMISPGRTKIFFIAYKKVLNIKFDKLSDFKITDHIETIEHPYIVDLKSKTLTPFSIKGFTPCDDCSFTFRFGYTGWFSEDVLGLALPDYNRSCANDFGDEDATLCGTEEIPECPELENYFDWGKIFVDMEGNCLGNFPKFEGVKIPTGQAAMRGDGKHFIYYDNKKEKKLSCVSIGNVIDRTIVWTKCIDLSDTGYDEILEDHFYPLKFNLQARSVYGTDEWIWVRFLDLETRKMMPRLLNYVTGKFHPGFPPVKDNPYFSLSALPSSTGKYHLLTRSTGQDEDNTFMPKYKYLLDYAYYEMPDYSSPRKMEYYIFSSNGTPADPISLSDFGF